MFQPHNHGGCSQFHWRVAFLYPVDNRRRDDGGGWRRRDMNGPDLVDLSVPSASLLVAVILDAGFEFANLIAVSAISLRFSEQLSLVCMWLIMPAL